MKTPASSFCATNARANSSPRASFYALIIVSLISCCKPSIEPKNPLAGQIVHIDGKHLEGTEVLWDGNSNITIPVGSFAPYLQIPYDADGTCTFKLRDSEGHESRAFRINVDLPKGPFPAPRIEDIGVHKISPKTDGTFDIWLSVFTANASVNSDISVDGKTPTSIFYNAIPSAYFNQNDPSSPFDSHNDLTFDYPIFHYTQHIAYLPSTTLAGQAISVKVSNGDKHSKPYPYYLPEDSASLDSDNDGLLDSWEVDGYTPPGSSNKIDLRQMGCDPHRKDILVEVDWMDGAKPDNAIWSIVEKAFAQAPILNPNGSQGIGVHIDHGQFNSGSGGQTLPNHQILGFRKTARDANVDYVNFYTYKADSFSHDRDSIFHYCILGKTEVGGSSGQGETWGNDFIVTKATVWNSVIAEAGTFIHELGHNIGLRHGGIDNDAPDQDVTEKPNQESLMNYRYQWTGVSIDCDFEPEGVLTFSRGMFKYVPEIGIDNSKGICDCRRLPITPIEGPKAHSPWGMAVYNYDEWGNLNLNFRLPGSRILEFDTAEDTP